MLEVTKKVAHGKKKSQNQFWQIALLSSETATYAIFVLISNPV